MGGEDGSDINMAFATKGNSETGLPLVKVSDDGCGGLASDILEKVQETNKQIDELKKTHVAEEPGDEITKDNGLVCLVVIWGTGNAGKVPQITLPLIKTRIHRASVKEQHMRISLDKPATVESLYALRLHGLEGRSKVAICGVLRLNLHRGGLVGEGTDEAVSVAKLGNSDGDFGLDDRVDAADLVGDFPCTFEQQRMLHASLPVVAHVGSSTAQLLQDPDSRDNHQDPSTFYSDKTYFLGCTWSVSGAHAIIGRHQKILPKIEHPSGKDDSVCQWST